MKALGLALRKAVAASRRGLANFVAAGGLMSYGPDFLDQFRSPVSRSH